VNGKLLGRLAFRGWRDGWRADRRWARGRDERLWEHEAWTELAEEREESTLRCPYGCCSTWSLWDDPWPFD
jgi:hypothetical protein